MSSVKGTNRKCCGTVGIPPTGKGIFFLIFIPVPFIFYYFLQLPTNGQLSHKLSHSCYMFRHYCDILREFVINVSQNNSASFYFAQWPNNALLSHKLSQSCYMFRHYCDILREFVINVLQNNSASFYFVQWPNNAQLSHKLSQSCYMFRHYCDILRKLAVSTLPSYTCMSNAAAGNTD